MDDFPFLHQLELGLDNFEAQIGMIHVAKPEFGNMNSQHIIESNDSSSLLNYNCILNSNNSNTNSCRTYNQNNQNFKTLTETRSQSIDSANGTDIFNNEINNPNTSQNNQTTPNCLQNSINLLQSTTKANDTSTNQMSKKMRKSPTKPRPKPRCPIKRQNQRDAANVRERSRMKTINEAFDDLKERIPLVCKDRKVSKVDTLRLAIRYIHHLRDTMGKMDISSFTNQNLSISPGYSHMNSWSESRADNLNTSYEQVHTTSQPYFEGINTNGGLTYW